MEKTTAATKMQSFDIETSINVDLKKTNYFWVRGCQSQVG